MAEAGVIFDLDGVLIDSEGLYYRAYSEVLKPYGVTVTQREYEDYWIAQGIGPEYIVKKHNLPVAPGELRKLRSPIFLDLLKTEATLMPHVEETLSRLSQHFGLTVATNSNREHLDFVLKRFDIDQFFPQTVARHPPPPHTRRRSRTGGCNIRWDRPPPPNTHHSGSRDLGHKMHRRD